MARNPNKVLKNFELSREQALQFEERCKAEGRSDSDLIRRALQLYYTTPVQPVPTDPLPRMSAGRKK